MYGCSSCHGRGCGVRLGQRSAGRAPGCSRPTRRLGFVGAPRRTLSRKHRHRGKDTGPVSEAQLKLLDLHAAVKMLSATTLRTGFALQHHFRSGGAVGGAPPSSNSRSPCAVGFPQRMPLEHSTKKLSRHTRWRCSSTVNPSRPERADDTPEPQVEAPSSKYTKDASAVSSGYVFLLLHSGAWCCVVVRVGPSVGDWAVSWCGCTWLAPCRNRKPALSHAFCTNGVSVCQESICEAVGMWGGSTRVAMCSTTV